MQTTKKTNLILSGTRLGQLVHKMSYVTLSSVLRA